MVNKTDQRYLRRFRKAPLLVLTGALLFAGTALGAWTIVGHTVNLLTMAAYQTRIEEKYKAPSVLLPSQKVEKTVNVKNTGQTDAFIRVKVDKAFGHLDENGSFVEDEELDTDVIQVSFDSTGTWIKAADGYWYYTEVLKAGDTTKVPLMDSYILSPLAGNEYKGKQGRILVRMESIQAEGEAVLAWNTQEKNLGLVYEKAVTESKAASVIFTGKDRGFTFTADHADLFIGFKALTPGCTRTQTVTVENAHTHAVRILLQGTVTEQEKMSEEEQALVKKLLSEDACITITHNGKVLYDGPVDGNLQAEEKGRTLSRPISLGGFAPGEKKDLIISLKVSPETESGEYALLGRVGWDFLAEGDDTWKGGYPNTGDESPVLLWSLILIFSALVITTAWLTGWKCKRRKRRRR